MAFFPESVAIYHPLEIPRHKTLFPDIVANASCMCMSFLHELSKVRMTNLGDIFHSILHFNVLRHFYFEILRSFTISVEIVVRRFNVL